MEAKPPSQHAICAKNKDTGETTVLFDPTPTQLEFAQATETNVFLWGNRGGGKSFAARWMAHGKAISHSGFKYIVVRRSFPELTKNHLVYLDEEMKLLGGTYHKTEHICYYPNGSIGFFAACANDADVKKVVGAEAALIVFDEAPELEWEWMRLISASVRVPKNSGLTPMVRYLGNPIGTSIDHLWQYFIDKDVDPLEDPEYRPQDWRAIEIRLEDNPHLDREVYRRQFAGIASHIRKAWLDGVRVEDRALFELRPTKEVEVVDPETGQLSRVKKPYQIIDALPTVNGHSVLFEPWIRIYRAYDHGFIDPAVCLWFAVIGKRIICFKEQVWTRTPADQIAKDILQAQIIYDAEHPEGYVLPVTATYCDPSIDLNDGSVYTIRDSMELQSLTHNGRKLTLPLDPSINNREQCVDAIHRALLEEVDASTPRLAFVRDGCPYLLKSLPKMRFDERNPRRMADHKHDHGPITLGYFLVSWIPDTAPAKPKTNSAAMQWLRDTQTTREFTIGRKGYR